MRLSILGGAGFIGSNFVRHTQASTMRQSHVIDKLTYAGRRENLIGYDLPLYEEDICNTDALKTIFAKEKPDVVINFAAESHVSRSITNPESFTRTNVVGAQSVLEAMRASCPTARLIHISTDEVFGQQSEWQKPWHDYDQLNPRSPYAASKAAGELLARSYFTTYGLDVIIVRPSNCFGQNQFPEKLIPRAITNLIDGQKIKLMGEGLQMRDWLLVDDLCKKLNVIIEKGTAGECYNIPANCIYRNRDIVGKILQYMGKTWDDVERIPHRLAHDFKYHVAGEGIDKLMGVASTKTYFDYNLQSVLKWYVNNENWWRPLKEEAELGNQNDHKAGV